MALTHAASGDLLDVRPLGTKLPQAKSHALVQSPSIEIALKVASTDSTSPALTTRPRSPSATEALLEPRVKEAVPFERENSLSILE